MLFFYIYGQRPLYDPQPARGDTFASLRPSFGIIDISDPPELASMSTSTTVSVPVKAEPVEQEPSLQEALETMMEEMAPEADDGLQDSFEADEDAGKELHEDVTAHHEEGRSQNKRFPGCRGFSRNVLLFHFIP